LKAMMYAGFGGPDQLHLADIPTPTPEGDQILVRVRASSINSWDWDKLRGPRGLTRLLGPQDTILGCDVSGEVVSCGPEAGDFKAGDRVFGDLSFYGFGAYAEFACASQSAFCAIPEGLDYLQAASLPQGGVLALQGLGGDPSALAGKRVLVVGAGGSVGPFAIQLAHHAGATVSAVDRSDKLPWLESLGVETAIDYQSRDFTALDPDSYRSYHRCSRENPVSQDLPGAGPWRAIHHARGALAPDIHRLRIKPIRTQAR
jgi:NADPH:quinone reductase-like Zn-dependent oxidoreductase